MKTNSRGGVGWLSGSSCQALLVGIVVTATGSGSGSAAVSPQARLDGGGRAITAITATTSPGPETVFQAVNQENNFAARVTGSAIRFSPALQVGNPWTLDLEVRAFGLLGEAQPLDRPMVVADGLRVVDRYGPLSRTVVNSAAGLEQEFEIAEGPTGDRRKDPQVIRFAVVHPTTLTSELGKSDQSLRFLDERGDVTLVLSIVRATDASGTLVPTRLEYAAETRSLVQDLDLIVEGAGATYPLHVTLRAARLEGPSPAESPTIPGLPIKKLEATTDEDSQRVESVLVAPANDTCGGAEVIPGAGPFPYLTAITADITDATTAGDPSPLAGCPIGTPSPSRGIWYSFTPSTTGPHSIATCADSATGSTVDDTLLDVYTSSTGTCAGTMTAIACDDDACASENLQSTVTVNLTAGTPYFIVVHKWDNVAPTAGNTAIQLRVSLVTPPANDTCSGAIPLALNIPKTGSTLAGTNDYTLSGTGCFSLPTPPTPVGQTASTAPGRDVVYSFTAAGGGLYSFRVRSVTGGVNPVLYVVNSCPPPSAIPTPPCLGAANRRATTVPVAEEVMCLPIPAGTTVYAFVDDNTLTAGGSFTVEVNACTRETEPNDTPAAANNIAGVCGIEASSNPGGNVDFFSPGAVPPDARIFAFTDNTANNTGDHQMRVTTTADTFEYDDDDGDVSFGASGFEPVIAGTRFTPGGPAYLRVNPFSATLLSEPYRLYHVEQPPSAAAVAEIEPNDPPSFNTAASNYFSGITSTTDQDNYSFGAVAGDLIYVSADNDPDMDGVATDTTLGLFDPSGTLVSQVNGSAAVSSIRTPVLGLVGTTPVAPGEALVYRALVSGTYTAAILGVAAGPGNYLLSISKNCAPGGGGGGFPPAGTDLSPTTGIFHVDVKGLGPVETSASGMTLLQWQNPHIDPGTGKRTVQTEMLSMNLTGSSSNLGSLTIRAGSQQGLPPSLGSVTQNGPGSDFPALATFDVFFEVQVAGLATLRNSQPLVMQADITEIPPRAIGLRNSSPVLITDILDPTQVSVLRTAQHWMCPPPFPQGEACPVPCNRSPFPVCSPGNCPGTCSVGGAACQSNADCPVPGACVFNNQCVPNAATAACECKPGYPTAGTDVSPTTGIFRVDVAGIGPVDTSVAGQTTLQWQNPVTDPATGHRTIQTEMLSLDLSGSDPTLGSLHVLGGSANGLPASLGRVTSIVPGADFPADAFFDVFFDVTVNGTTTLRNDQPLVMRADITEIPPRNIGLRNDTAVPLRNLANPQQINTIQTAQHWMCPPPFPPPGVPCPVPCDRSPFPACGPGTCPNATQHCVGVPPFFPQDAGEGSCVCVEGFPPAGTDNSPTVGTFRVDLGGIGPVETSVNGQTLLQWQNPVVGPGGQRTVQTELLSLDLAGSSPSIGNLTVQAGSAHGLPPSTGSVVPLGPGSDFPALATFDVFFEVVVAGTTTLRNNQPLVMRAPITEIPPRSIGLQNAAPVQITDLANPAQINTIQTAQHWMCPPPFPPPGVPCPVPCDRNPFPVCRNGTCPTDLPLCVPDRSTQACRCVKPFPSHGVDLSPTTGIFRVAIDGLGLADAQVSGEVLLRWQDPVTDPGTGQRTVQTEMLSLDLSGSSPTLGNLHVTGGSNLGLPATLGSVTPIDSGGDFPANAFFDVFFEVTAGGATLRNDQPLVMQAEITEIPPRSIGLRNAAPVPLRNVNDPAQNNSIQTAAHFMCPEPYLPPGVPCPVQCNQLSQPLCSFGACPPGLICTSNSAGCACLAPPPPTSGAVPDRGPAIPLKLTKLAGGQIKLDWGASCLASDTDYSIYDGQIGSYYSHAALFCSTGGLTTMSFAPAAGRRYYLVVPHQSSVEGSYGPRSGGVERPQGASACLPQAIGTCP